MLHPVRFVLAYLFAPRLGAAGARSSWNLHFGLREISDVLRAQVKNGQRLGV
jgi:hypothetical protein